MHRHPCVLVNVHPRFLDKAVVSANHSLTSSPRMNNLHSNAVQPVVGGAYQPGMIVAEAADIGGMSSESKHRREK